MPRKSALERIADIILLDAALKEGYVTSMRNRHGFGKWMRERGMLHAKMESEIAEHEKTGFTEEQVDEINEHGLDTETRRRYH
jgi:hypothetical protein